MKNLIITSIFLFTILSFGQNHAENTSITNNSVPYPGLRIFSHADADAGHPNGSGNSQPIIEFLHSSGTSTNQTQTQGGKNLGSLIFNGHDGTDFNQAGRIVVATRGSQSYTNGDNTFMHFRLGGSTYGTTRMSILGDSGNVGIGSAFPTERLTVNGKILCEEVEVIQDVLPDYVFQKYYTGISELKSDYIMPTLEEIELFTKANHHLPQVPSAAEVKENGMQLKEMTTILLQKIEELTLYTIEQEKRIKALEAGLKK